MRIMKKTKTFVFLFLILVSLFNYVPFVRSDPTNNLFIYFEQLTIQPDGMYSRAPAFGAIITISKIDTEWNVTKVTDTGGVVAFSINETNTYFLNGTFSGLIYFPKNIFVDITKTTTYNDVFVRTSQYVITKQLTKIRELDLNLPCSVIISYPRSTNVTKYTEAYGLHYEEDTQGNYYLVSPKDPSEELKPLGNTFFYPNYTINLAFKTLEEGEMILTVVSSGKFLMQAEPFYFVGSNIDVNFTVVIHVSKLLVEEQVSNMTNQMNTVLALLTDIKKILTVDLLPSILKIDTTFTSFVTKYFGNVTIPQVFSSINTLMNSMDLFNRELGTFRETISANLDKKLSFYLSDFRNTTFMLVIITILIFIVVIAEFVQKRQVGKQEIVTEEGFTGA